MELTSRILKTVLEAALPVLITAAAAWMVGKAVEIFRNIAQENPDAAAYLFEICSTAVRAAEQIFGGEKEKEKKAYALRLVQAYLERIGLRLDLETIDAAIEAAVLEMNLELELPGHGSRAEERTGGGQQ